MMPSDAPLVDAARLASLRRALPERSFARSVAAFRKSLTTLSAEIRQAIAEQRWADAARAAHSIKGVSGNFGAARIAGESGVLEASLDAGDYTDAVRRADDLAGTALQTLSALDRAAAAGDDASPTGCP